MLKLQRISSLVYPIWMVAIAFTIGMVSACSPVRRQATLEFFFDGVPPYRTPEELVRIEEERQIRLAESKQEDSAARSSVQKLSRFTHGPFASDECTTCHDLQQSSGFTQRADGMESAPSSTSDLAEGGRLRMPVDELCVHCHTDYSVDVLEVPDSWVHGPVASGWCIACHQPHSSVNSRLVTYDPPARLCGTCHVRSSLVDNPKHIPESPDEGYPPIRLDAADGAQPRKGRNENASAGSAIQVVADCTRCHDPHRGADRRLLHAIPPVVETQRIHAPQPINPLETPRGTPVVPVAAYRGPR